VSAVPDTQYIFKQDLLKEKHTQDSPVLCSKAPLLWEFYHSQPQMQEGTKDGIRILIIEARKTTSITFLAFHMLESL
jgi:hypothetical protein